MPQWRQASVCGSAAALRSGYVSQFAPLRLRSTFPLADHRPKPRRSHWQPPQMKSPTDHFWMPQSTTERLPSHSASRSDSAMKRRFILWRQRAHQGYYGSVRLDAPASVPPSTRPPPPGSFASRFSSPESVCSNEDLTGLPQFYAVFLRNFV